MIQSAGFSFFCDLPARLPPHRGPVILEFVAGLAGCYLRLDGRDSDPLKSCNCLAKLDT